MTIFDTIAASKAKSDAYDAMSPADKKAYVKTVFDGAIAAYNEKLANGSRRGTTQGYAFLWVNLYGKGKLSNAMRKYINANDHRRIIRNYRGAKAAWYFGSQSDLGIYDAMVEMAEYLSANGIECFVEDAWD